MAKKFTIDKSHKRSLVIDGWLVKLERKAFGWIYYGEHTNVTTEIITEHRAVSSTRVESRTREKNSYVTWLHFKRVSPYTSNLFFKFLELISNVTSFIRRVIAAALTWVVPILAILGIVTKLFGAESGALELALTFAALYAFFCILPALILSLIASQMRKRTGGIEDQLKRQLRENGYDDDLEDI